MYIYEAKGLDFSGTKGNGLIVAPEKAGCDPFTPVAVGDTCLLVVPYFDDETNTNAIAFMDDYTVAFSDSTDPAINEGMKLFAFQGEVTGEFGTSYGRLKGVIFKPVQNQNEMNPIIEDGMIVFGIADEVDTGDGYEHLDTPMFGIITANGTPSITLDKSSASVKEAETTTVNYETIPHISDNEIEVAIGDDTVCGVTLDKGKAEIEGLKAGETVVTLTITVNGKDYSAELAVTVTE